jgi:hypothetical protein
MTVHKSDNVCVLFAKKSKTTDKLYTSSVNGIIRKLSLVGASANAPDAVTLRKKLSTHGKIGSMRERPIARRSERAHVVMIEAKELSMLWMVGAMMDRKAAIS